MGKSHIWKVGSFLGTLVVIVVVLSNRISRLEPGLEHEAYDTDIGVITSLNLLSTDILTANPAPWT